MMTAKPRHFPPRSLPRGAATRRGGVYILVLASATLLALTGLSVVALTRIQIKTDSQAGNTDRAADLAATGVHAALSFMHFHADWRSSAAAGDIQGMANLETGSARWWLRDISGGAVSANPLRPVHVYGMGASSSGESQRIYRVTAEPPSVQGLDVLRCAIHSNDEVIVEQAEVQYGPVSSNSIVTCQSELIGDVEAPEFGHIGVHVGAATAPSPQKTMPTPTNSLASLATPISYAPTAGRIDRKLFTAASNPYGLPNSEGVYSITVPSNSALEIQDCRLQATLIVTLQSRAQLIVQNSVFWQPADVMLPTLIVNGSTNATVLLKAPYDRPLSEGSVTMNFNPALSPFMGVADADTTDTYPCRIDGVVHIQTGIATTVENRQHLFGCLISMGPVTLNDALLWADPQLLAAPPSGYLGVAPTMTIKPDSWTWVSVEETTLP